MLVAMRWGRKIENCYWTLTTSLWPKEPSPDIFYFEEEENFYYLSIKAGGGGGGELHRHLGGGMS